MDRLAVQKPARICQYPVDIRPGIHGRVKLFNGKIQHLMLLRNKGRITGINHLPLAQGVCISALLCQGITKMIVCRIIQALQRREQFNGLIKHVSFYKADCTVGQVDFLLVNLPKCCIKIGCGLIILIPDCGFGPGNHFTTQKALFKVTNLIRKPGFV